MAIKLLENLSDLSANPLTDIKKFWQRAKNETDAGTTMALSTIDRNGYPSVRYVLFKEITETGLHFYTNYQSEKAAELEVCPKASGVIYWPGIDLQVRIKGDVEKLTSEESDSYFKNRDRDSQLGAWASMQSRPLDSRDTLIQSAREYEQKFVGKEVPRPPHWGGYKIEVFKVQFMARREHRLHDSFVCEKQKDGVWRFSRVYP